MRSDRQQSPKLYYFKFRILLRYVIELMSVFQPEIVKQIQMLKQDLNAIILAHNYQIPEIQDIADYIGDSLALSRKASDTNADIIVFCGVHFMAETAAILCPEKTVLIPDLEAGCSLASTINADELSYWKRQHPDAIVVSYVNTTAEIKALSDYCCTSSNAVKIVNSVPLEKEILFLPDMFLGSYVSQVTGRKNMHIWPGECHVHAGIRSEDINAMFKTYPNAEFLIHPECGCTSSTLYNLSMGDISRQAHVLSTEGMMEHVRKSSSDEFVIATETGIIHRMKQESPNKNIIPIREDATCKYMKKITLDKVLDSLTQKKYRVTVDDKIGQKARISIDRMLKAS
jgi:quinolinate synthase